MLQHLVVDRDGADDGALAARLRVMQAQQADDVAAVGMERQLVVGLVAAVGRVGERLVAEVLDVAEQVALRVLRHRLADPGADAEIGDAALQARVAMHRHAADQRQAAPFDHVVRGAGRACGRARAARSRCASGRAAWCRASRPRPTARSRSAISAGGQLVDPALVAGEIVLGPAGGIDDRLHRHGGLAGCGGHRRPPALFVGAKCATARSG